MKYKNGFTLLEILVVIIIGALLISFVSISFNKNSNTELIREAERLALLFEIANNESKICSRIISWNPTNKGFCFKKYTENKWHVLNDDILKERNWKAKIINISISYFNSNIFTDHLIFNSENSDIPVKITLFSNIGNITIIGTGNGRYEIQKNK